MEQYLKQYIQEMQERLENAEQLQQKRTEWKTCRKEMLTKISFFQHERLIHLIVTVTFAILLFLSLIFCFICDSFICFILPALLLVLLIPYIRHYYILENGVQKLYRIYDQLFTLYK